MPNAVLSVEQILATAANTLRIEADALARLPQYLTEDFALCALDILHSRGRVVVTGIGKSAIIAQKITATLNSTGTQAMFMHAADAIHGDLGMVTEEDRVICISKSGETPEIKVLVPMLKKVGNKLSAITGNINAYLAKQADYVLNATVAHEACPNNLAPTSSTTAQMALGDALAVCLLELRGFSASDFARFHPGGALGKQLYLSVDDIYPQNAAPRVLPDASIGQIILEMTSNRLGATAVTNSTGQLLGIITDGDLRRLLQRNTDFIHLLAKDIMTTNPISIQNGALAIDALQIMQQHKITQLIVTHPNQHYAGMLHIHDLLREGLV